jgi:hypothetical protein
VNCDRRSLKQGRKKKKKAARFILANGYDFYPIETSFTLEHQLCVCLIHTALFSLSLSLLLLQQQHLLAVCV